MYKCIITSDSTWGREYEVETKSAMKCAMELGRGGDGETVIVETKKGKLISMVTWMQEDGGKYVRCYIG